MNTIMNPWELGSDLSQTSNTLDIPNFVKAKYMVVRVTHPKGKTIRDGLVVTAVMTSYFDKDNNEIKTVEVKEGTSGYEVSFPLGKQGILATKYRGPKSMYKFLNPETKKFYQISNDKFTTAYAEQYLKQSIQGWDTLSPIEQDTYIDEYFENMYVFGMANDFNLDTSKKGYVVPKPGLVTSFYRQFTPPAMGEKYGNIIITKWPSKQSPEGAGKEALSGEYKEFDEAVALAIYDKLTERVNTKVDFIEADDDDVI